MAPRNVNVVHLLIPRRMKGLTQFLFFPHARWRLAEGDRPLLALPTKKFAGRKAPLGGARRLEDALSAILRDDLGLAGGPPADRLRLPRARAQLISPTHQVPTTYAVSPVLTPVPALRHAGLARRLRGEWLTPDEALRHAHLSPTARPVLARCATLAVDWMSARPKALLGSPRDRAWTNQLLAAKDGDIDLFGALLEEMRPLLLARLRACIWTRDLGAEAEDALHEAAVNALEHLHTFDPLRGSALSWLWSITRNCAVSALRGRGRRAALSLSANEVDEDQIGSADLSPAALAEAREEVALVQRRLAEALDAAGPLARRAWEMRFAGLPYATIATELGMPIGSVATCIHRLRQQGRQALSGPTRER